MNPAEFRMNRVFRTIRRLSSMMQDFVPCVLPAIVPGAMLLALAGCGVDAAGGSATGDTAPSSSETTPHVLTGVAMGGRQPIIGSVVTAYIAGAAGATQIGQATTDKSGNFSIASFNPAPSTGQIVYLVALGGDAGGGVNSAIRLVTVAGAYCAAAGCGFASAVDIDELSTVAAVYSLAQFFNLSGGGTLISGVSPGLDNAAATFGNLVDAVSGQAAALLGGLSCSGSSTPPNCSTLQKLDTLADIIASCVNSSGPSAAACSGLFSVAQSSSDTLSALLAIATMPAARNNASGLYALLTPPEVYSPALNAVPGDWTLALNFGGGGLNEPAELAVDAIGNIWVTDSVLSGALSKFSPTGAALSPAAGFTGNGLSGPLGLAIDDSGNVWVANWSQGSGKQISKFNADGSAAANSPFSGGGMEGPIDLAFDPAGDLWIANFGNSSMSELTAAGAFNGPINGNGFNFPVAIAVDGNGNVFVANQSGDSVSAFNESGAPLGAYSGVGLKQPTSMALDPGSNLWVTNFSGLSLTELIGGSTPPSSCPAPPVSGDSGCPLSPTAGFTGGGLAGPNGVAIDSAGQVWVANFHGNNISEFTSNGTALSPTAGYAAANMSDPYSIVADPSGNLWVTNYGNNSLTEFLGIAAPVATPKMGPPRAP